MRHTITSVLIPLLILGTIWAAVVSGCAAAAPDGDSSSSGNDADTEDSTVTVVLENANKTPEEGGEYFAVFIYPEDTVEDDRESQILAVNHGEIEGELTGETFMMLRLKRPGDDNVPLATDWTGTGGTTYDAYIYIADGKPSSVPADELRVHDPYPLQITIDANFLLNVDYEELVDPEELEEE